jgi:hypothetical protein
MIFNGSPHWGLQGMRPGYIDLHEYYNKDQKMFAWEERPSQRVHYIDSDMKYYFVYGRSNHCVLHYYNDGKTPELFQKKEEIRQKFRSHCENNNIQYSLESLTNFWKNNELTDTMKYFINSERLIKRFYRLNILNESLETINNQEDYII